MHLINNCFISIGDDTSCNASLNHNFNTYMGEELDCNLVNQSITADTVLRFIDNLKVKTSAGIDNILNKMLKYVKNVIAKPLMIIINKIFELGVFPDQLKILKILPLYKKGDVSNFSNYRPSLFLPSISILFLKKTILEQITDYLDINNLIQSS